MKTKAKAGARQRKKKAAKLEIVRPKNFFLNEEHTTHVSKATARRERTAHKTAAKKTAAQKRAARMAAIAVFTIYQDKAKEYRWRLKASNGKIIADSGEGYAKKFNAHRALGRFRGVVADAKLKE